MNIKYLLGFFLIFFIQTSVIFSQDSDTLEYNDADTLITRTEFIKTLSIYNFNNNFKFRKELFSGFTLDLNNNFNSTILVANPKNIRDLNNFNISLMKNIFDGFYTGTKIRSKYAFDDKNIGLSNIVENHYLIYNKYLDTKERLFLFDSEFGLKTERVLLKDDLGGIYSLSGELKDYRISNFIINSNGRYYFENLSERKNSNHNINLKIQNNFSDIIQNLININFYSLSKEFYFRNDSTNQKYFGRDLNIEKRTDDILQILEKLDYSQFIRYFDFKLETELFFRNIEKSIRYKNTSLPNKNLFDEKINEFRFNILLGFDFNYRWLSSNLKLIYSEREETHQALANNDLPRFLFDIRQDDEFQKNNIYSKVQILLENIISLSSTEKIYSSIIYSILKYDTPSQKNNDDRDEQFIGSKLKFESNPFSFFSYSINLEALLNHQIYLFAERSSNNKWDRVLRAYVNSNYVGQRLKTKNSAEILANYSVFDYEGLIPNIKSFAFRQLYIYDTSEVKLSDYLYFYFNLGARFSEQSFLKWSSFSIQPQRYLEEIFSDIKIGILNLNKYVLTLGIRIFNLKEYKFYQNNKLSILNRTTSIGPLFESDILLFERLNLKGMIWYEIISGINNYKKNNMNFQLKLFYNY